MDSLVAPQNKTVLCMRKIFGCESIFSIYLVLTILFWIINFLMVTDGNNLISFPVHHDDYTNLSSDQIKLSFRLVRPVSTIIIAIFASLGSGYYIVMNIMTILYPALVIYFLYNLFEKPPSAVLVVIYGICVFSFPPTLEYTKYTGLMTNMLSITFGILAIIILLKSFRESNVIFSVGGVLFFILSIFSKEDFILPCLLIMAYLILVNYGRNAIKLRQAILVFVSLILCVATLYVYNKYVAISPFTTQNTGVYAVSFSIKSIFSTIINYSKMDWYVLPLVVVTGLMTLIKANNDAKVKIILTLLVMLSLVLPYTVLPNHIYDYYTFNWMPWGASALVIFISIYMLNYKNKLFRCTILTTAIILSLIIMYKNKPVRESKISWYKTESAINKNFTNFIVANRETISNSQYVGIVGVEKFSPWSNTDGRYFKRNLGFNNKWIVFVDESDIFYQINSDNKLNAERTINVLNLTETHKFSNILYIQFDLSGNGSLTKDTHQI